MARRKAKISQLTRQTHKGRKASTNSNPSVMAQYGRGVRMTGFRGDPREASMAFQGITPTPSGPEPGRGGTMF